MWVVEGIRYVEGFGVNIDFILYTTWMKIKHVSANTEVGVVVQVWTVIWNRNWYDLVFGA